MSTLSGTTSKNLWPFSPQSIPGLALWLDGADTNTLTSTTWKDKSGLGYVGTATAITSSTQNGLNAANLGTNQVVLSPSFIWQNAFTMFVVAKVTNQFFINMWSPSTADHSYGRNFMYTGNYDLMVVGGFGCDDSVLPLGTSVIPLGEYMIFVIGYNNGSVATPYAVNGTTRTTKNGSASYGSKTGEYTIIADSGGQIVAELIHFNNNLNTSQSQQVEGYLAAKWGLQSTLPATHPYYATSTMQLYKRPVFQRTFQPTDISGCALWLDAADATTVTGTSTVTAWADKSGQGYSMIAGTGTTTYTVYGPGPSIKLNTSYLYVNKAVDLTQFTMFSVLLSQTAVGNQPTVTGRPNTSASYGSTDGFGLYVDASGPSLRFYTSTYISDGTPASSGNSLGLVLSTYTATSAGALSSWFNGVAKSTLSTSARTSTAKGFSIGGEWSGSAYVSQSGTGSVANVYEVIVFTTVLTSSQRQQVESYLAWKWGLVSNLVSGHPGRSLPSFSATFTPKSISGMSLWLDAADPTTVTGTTTVTAWADKSGNGNNGIPISSGPTLVQSVQNGLPGLTFPTTASIMLCGNLLTGTNYSMFAVVKYASSGTQTALGEWKIRYGSGLFFSQGKSVVATVSATTTYNEFGPLVAADTSAFHIYAASLSSSTSSSSATLIAGTDGNDTTYTNSGGPNTAATSDPFAVGGDYENSTAYYPVTGYICEVIVYTAALPTSQIQQVEGYLAWKWGLQNNLPSTHSFKKFKP